MFSGTGQNLSLVPNPELGDLTSIREVSRNCQHLSLGIFLELKNLTSIQQVLQLVVLSRVLPSVFILPIVLLNLLVRHTAIIE